MIVKHTLTISAICPVDGRRDWYTCTVTLDRLIPCEQLVADTAKYAGVEIYQEGLTKELSEQWQATVRTTGTHVRRWWQAIGAVGTEVIAFPKTRVAVNPTGEHA